MNGMAWFRTLKAPYFLSSPSFLALSLLSAFSSLCTFSWHFVQSPAMFPIVLEPCCDFGTIWWKCSISFLQRRHFPSCRSQTAAWRSSKPFSGPFWKSTPDMEGSSSCMNANRFTSIPTSVTGRYLCIRCTRLTWVCTRWRAEGVSHPSGRFRLENLACVFRMTWQVMNLSASYCGSFLISSPAFSMVPNFLASLWRALRSPLREALRHCFRFSMSFAISLLRVSTFAENRRSPFRERAASPILVRPGSSARVTG